jgi:hypothetical protein
MNPGNRPDGTITYVSGSSRSGKTAYTYEAVKRERRVLVWDPEDQWARRPGFKRVTKIRDLLRLLMTTPGPLKVAYVPTHLVAEFGEWARLAFTWAKLGPCHIVAEETADVTSPGKAPHYWGILIRRVAKYGGSVWGITQRPAESDKTIVGNAGVVVTFRMSRNEDRAYMARELDVPKADIDPLKNLEFIRKDNRTGEVKRGKLQF